MSLTSIDANTVLQRDSNQHNGNNNSSASANNSTSNNSNNNNSTVSTSNASNNGSFVNNNNNNNVNGNRQSLQHPTKGPLVFASAEGDNQIAAFDLYTGDCRMILRAGGNNGDLNNGGASNTPLTSNRSKTSPINNGTSGSSSNSSSSRSKPSSSSSSSSGFGSLLPSLRPYARSELQPATLDEQFAKELQTVGKGI